MPYRSAKVYNDGSHYIAIPQTNNPTKQKKNPTRTVCTGKELQTAKNKTDKTAMEILTPKERFETIYIENNGKKKKPKTVLKKNSFQVFRGGDVPSKSEPNSALISSIVAVFEPSL